MLSACPDVIAIEPTGGSAVTPMAVASDFVAQQLDIEAELRAGANRLQSVCKKKAITKPLKESTETVLVQSRIRDKAASLAALESRLTSVTSAHQADVQKSKANNCSAIDDFFRKLGGTTSAMTGNCAALERAASEAKALAASAQQYREISRKRMDIFREIADMESRGCTRAGFTGKMLDLYDQNNAPAENGVVRLYEALIDRLKADDSRPSGSDPR